MATPDKYNPKKGQTQMDNYEAENKAQIVANTALVEAQARTEAANRSWAQAQAICHLAASGQFTQSSIVAAVTGSDLSLLKVA